MKYTTKESFLNKVNEELQRAERYRIFISLTVFDLSTISNQSQADKQEKLEKIMASVKDNIRTIDYASMITNDRLGLLFPETTRQGAEIVARRISEIIKETFSVDIDKSSTQNIVPLEMASYPDAGGAKSIKDFMVEWTELSKN